MRLIAAICMFWSVPVWASEPRPIVTSPPTRTGQIYLFRGLIGLMTPSMDQFARELRTAGFSAFSYEDVLGHLVVGKSERDYARAGEHEPIILLGYSSGAVTALPI